MEKETAGKGLSCNNLKSNNFRVKGIIKIFAQALYFTDREIKTLEEDGCMDVGRRKAETRLFLSQIKLEAISTFLSQYLITMV